MLGEQAIAGIITGIIRNHKLDQWGRLLIGAAASGICSFFGSLGTAGLAHLVAGQPPIVALAFAFFEACLASAAVVFWLWTRNPLSKHIPISVPTSVEIEANKILTNQGITSFGGKQ
jgi:hypothetical protein